MASKRTCKKLILNLFLSLFLISCGSIPSNTEKISDTSKRYIECYPISEKGELICSISYDQLNFFDKTGKKLTAHADSGERIELWWKFDWIGRGYFFPQLHFVLIYFNPNGSEVLKKGIYIGECRFSRGCNHGHYRGPDTDSNGIPDYFSEIVWDNWDYGFDSEREGYFHHYRHVFRPQENYYTVLKYTYLYPEKCKPPMSLHKEVCNLKEECKPPYLLKEIKVMESRSF